MPFEDATHLSLKGLPLATLLSELADEVGAKLYLEPKFKAIGYIQFPDAGRRFYFKGTSLDVNPHGAASIAADKSYSAEIIGALGYPTPPSVLLFSPGYKSKIELRNERLATRLNFADPAFAFAKTHGFPLYLKPNEGSAGDGVSCVRDLEELFRDLFVLFRTHERVLLQVPVAGDDYRLLVLEDAVVAAYRRRPLAVVGDGKSTIRSLLACTLGQLADRKGGRKIAASDKRLARQLERSGLCFDSVPRAGHAIPLLASANLSTGGTAEDVMGEITQNVREQAIAITKALSLRFAGVDLLSTDISDVNTPGTVLEVNAAPGLMHFASTSPDAMARVRDVYRKLLVVARRLSGA